MANTSVLASRFCRCEAPASWLPFGPTGLVEGGSRRPRCGAALSESWIDPPRQLSELVPEQRTIVLSERRGAEVVRDERVSTARFPDAHLITYRIPTGRGPLLLRQLLTLHGPLLCALSTTSPEGDDEAEELVAAVAASFAVPAAAWATRVRRLQPHLEVDAARPECSAPVTLPHFQLAVPVPEGWSLDGEAGILRRGDVTIALRRHGQGRGADLLFADALARITREAGWAVTAWSRGELPRRRQTWSIEATQETRATWSPARHIARRLSIVELDGVAEVDMLAAGDDGAAAQAFEAVVAGLGLPAAPQRCLILRTPWLPARLDGPWAEVAPGVCLRAGATPLTVSVHEISTRAEYDTLVSQAIGTFDRMTAGARVTHRDVAAGSWQGVTATRLSLDWQPAEGPPAAVRAAWFETTAGVLALEIRGREGRDAGAVFEALLAEVRPDMASHGRHR